MENKIFKKCEFCSQEIIGKRNSAKFCSIVCNRKHFHDPFYKSWESMKDRCFRVKNNRFKNYGGRGISVCDSWTEYENFSKDMKVSYFKGATIERIDVNKGYSLENCKWATDKEQARNKRCTKKITFNWITKSVWDWADELQVPAKRILNRLKRGWSESDALNKAKRINQYI